MFGSAAATEPDRTETKNHPTALLLWTTLVVGFGAALYVTVRLASQSIAIGSEQGHFIYRYSQAFAASMLWSCTPLLATTLVLACAPLETVRRHLMWLLIAWFSIGFAQQAQIRTLTPFTFEAMFASDTANSFYGAAKQHDAAALLRHFRTVRRSLPLHAKSNMPGKILLVSALSTISPSANVQAWLVVLLSNLGAVFLYLIVVEWLADGDAALFAFVLYFFVPAKMYFFPLLNTATPTFALAWLWLFVRWIRTSRAVYAGLFGLVTYGLMLFDPLPLVLGLLFPAIVVPAARAGRMEWRTFARQTAVAVAAFAVVYAWMLSAFRFDLFRTFQQLGADAAAFNLDEDRRYGLWASRNLLDFWFGVGICQVALFAAVLVDSLRRSAKPDGLPPIAFASLGLAAVLAALDLLGVNRGEVIRLWVFLACLWQIPAAYVCSRLHSRTALVLVLGATVVQDALGTAMIGFVLP